MKLFRDFLKGFKPKYRVSHDRELGLKTRAFTSPAEGEVILYETYFRRMRQTGKTNLNLDVVNLLAYPPSKKLHSQLLKYPQEVIPAMDQVLKDMMLEIADMDHQAGLEGMPLVHNRCEYADSQVIRLQETPDAVLDGQTPHTVSLSTCRRLQTW